MARKKAQAFRTITEVSDWLDTPSHVLRFWESKFPQIKPVKRAGGRRYYRPEDLKLIGGIKHLLHDKGTTIAAVKEMIKTDGEEHVETFSPEPVFPEKGRRKLRKAKAKSKETIVDKREDEKMAIAVDAAATERAEDEAAKAKAAALAKAEEEKQAEIAAKAKAAADALAAKEAAAEAERIEEKYTDVLPLQPSDEAPEPLQLDDIDTAAEVDETPAPEPLVLNTNTQNKEIEPLNTQDTTADAPMERLTLSDPTPEAEQRETSARDVISNAISRTRHDEVESTNSSFSRLKSRTDIASNQILEIEDMYFQLNLIKNRMKRRLQAM